jgi:hypothetical protein
VRIVIAGDDPPQALEAVRVIELPGATATGSVEDPCAS